MSSHVSYMSHAFLYVPDVPWSYMSHVPYVSHVPKLQKSNINRVDSVIKSQYTSICVFP
jgi:hypothetical protein